MSLIAEIDKEVISSFCQKHGMKLAVLFGSRAKGRTGLRSDLDMAFLLGSSRSSADKAHLVAELMGLLHTNCLDVVILDRSDPLLAHEVAISGVSLYEVHPGAFYDFVVLALKRYYDAYKFRRLDRLYVEKFLKGETRIAPRGRI